MQVEIALRVELVSCEIHLAYGVSGVANAIAGVRPLYLRGSCS